MKLDEKLMKSFCVMKSYKENDGKVNSIHFSWDGLSLITSTDDDQIVIYDCETGAQKRMVNSQVLLKIFIQPSGSSYEPGTALNLPTLLICS